MPHTKISKYHIVKQLEKALPKELVTKNNLVVMVNLVKLKSHLNQLIIMTNHMYSMKKYLVGLSLNHISLQLKKVWQKALKAGY